MFIYLYNGFISALPAGAFVSLYGCRPVCLIGLVVYAIGTLSSAFTNNFYTLLFTFGFIKGMYDTISYNAI